MEQETWITHNPSAQQSKGNDRPPDSQSIVRPVNEAKNSTKENK